MQKRPNSQNGILSVMAFFIKLKCPVKGNLIKALKYQDGKWFVRRRWHLSGRGKGQKGWGVQEKS